MAEGPYNQEPTFPIKRSARLKTLRKKAALETVGLPKCDYERLRNGMIVAVKSTRARYLELKRMDHAHRN